LQNVAKTLHKHCKNTAQTLQNTKPIAAHNTALQYEVHNQAYLRSKVVRLYVCKIMTVDKYILADIYR